MQLEAASKRASQKEDCGVQTDIDAVDKGYEELVNLVNESEDALTRKIKEVREVRDKLARAEEENHRLAVESEVVKRELLDVKETSTKDKHVTVSHQERHKRERDQLLGKIEELKASHKLTLVDQRFSLTQGSFVTPCSVDRRSIFWSITCRQTLFWCFCTKTKGAYQKIL